MNHQRRRGSPSHGAWWEESPSAVLGIGQGGAKRLFPMTADASQMRRRCANKPGNPFSSRGNGEPLRWTGSPA
ncbi:MAG: hypothetical protein ICV78_24910 [Tolypothrix sp. Co-bin9]|nr:hypothetical protein [Tolypothrix sp. Co-bin9]